MSRVARGAVYYGRARRGRGVRIRSGAPRTYYIGIESAMPAVPGRAAPLKALCVVPFGMEEGSEAKIADREFGGLAHEALRELGRDLPLVEIADGDNGGPLGGIEYERFLGEGDADAAWSTAQLNRARATADPAARQRRPGTGDGHRTGPG